LVEILPFIEMLFPSIIFWAWDLEILYFSVKKISKRFPIGSLKIIFLAAVVILCA